MNHDDSFFSSVKIEKLDIDGEIIELPIRYYQAKSIVATFLAPLKKVKEILPTTRFRPIEILPGLSAISLISFEQLETSIGPFKELDIGVPVFLDAKFTLPLLPALNYHRFSNFGLYMYHVFVSSEKALIAGTKVWGFSKTVVDIAFSEDEQSRYLELSKDSEMIIKVSLKNNDKKTRPFAHTFFLYTQKDNKILKSAVNWKGSMYKERFTRDASFKIGTHSLSSYVSVFHPMNFCIEATYYSDLRYILNSAHERYSL
jgi:hypothetical protein